ncbi:hypothetical protein [Paenibacillus sp. y28]|uniref:hypothetical protein n=1 Tax=Paenibacillus sp. y28 TaxID=3129110 RepID=UPI0030168BFD
MDTQQPKGRREITYRVGWKKGIIRVPEASAVSGTAAEANGRGRSPGSRLEAALLREAKLPPAELLRGLFFSLPLFGFGAIWLLIYWLMWRVL